MTSSSSPQELAIPPQSGAAALPRAPLAWALAGTLLLAAGPWLPPLRFFSAPALYPPLHKVLEVVSIAVSAMVFGLAWNLRHQQEGRHRHVLGAALLAVCLIDLAHTLSYAGIPEMVTPSSPEKAINFWLAARAVAAAALLAVALRPALPCPAHACTAGAVLLAAAVWWVGLARPEWLPRTFVAGSGLTPFKVIAEYVLALVYAAAAVLLWRRAQRLGDVEWLWLAAAAWVQGLAEMFFTLYAGVTDIYNLLGHVYKVLAYLMIYRALFVSGVQQPYQALAAERARLTRLRQELHQRVKEREGLHEVFRLTEDLDAPLAGQLQAVAERLPAAWQRPDLAVARVSLAGHECASAAWQPRRVQRAVIRWPGGDDGCVEVGYREGGEPSPDFLPEEQQLLEAVAARLASVVAQRALRRHDTVFLAIASQADDSIVVVDREAGRFVEFNDAAARNLGYSREEFARLTVADIEARMDAATLEQRFVEVATHGAATFETQHRRKDGEIRDVLVRVRTLAIEGRAHFAAIVADITERKRAELRLRESEQHFRNLANGGVALIWTSDLNQQRDYFNEPWLRFTGRDLDQERGAGWAEGLHPEDRAACLGAGRAAFAGRSPYSLEYRLRRADGAWRWLREEATPRRDSLGRFVGYIGFCIDVTEQRAWRPPSSSATGSGWRTWSRRAPASWRRPRRPPRRRRWPRAPSWPTCRTRSARRSMPSSAWRTCCGAAACPRSRPTGWPRSTPPASTCWRLSTPCSTCRRSRPASSCWTRGRWPSPGCWPTWSRCCPIERRPRGWRW